MAFMSDLRFAFRHLLRRPGFLLAATSVLALGLGANAALFSVADAVVLRPLPYAEPDRLVTIWDANVAQGIEHERLSPVTFLDYRAQDHVFADAAAWWRPDVNLTDAGGEPIRVDTIEVSRNFFAVLGVDAVEGRTFLAAETLHDDADEVVIGHGLWQRRYGGDPAVVGATVDLNGGPHTVVGVAPPGFRYPDDTEVWQLLGWDLANHSRHAHFMESVARLAPGATVEAAVAELTALSARLEAEHPAAHRDWVARVVPLDREVLGEFRPAILALLGAVGLLLLLACANVASLLLARATAREREVAVRAALGAGRWRLMRQFLAESLVLAALGAAVGLALAVVAIEVFQAAPPVDVPRLAEVAVDGQVVAYVGLATLLTALLCGLAPALRLSSPRRVAVLQAGVRGAGGQSTSQRARSVLVVAEVALAVVLLVGAGLLMRSFLALLDEDPGFRTAGVTTANVMLPEATYGTWDDVDRFYRELGERLAAHPAIESAGGTSFLPLDLAWRIPYGVPGRPPAPEGQEPEAQYVTAVPGYFETLRIPLLAGRTLEPGDDAASAPVVVIDAELARRAFPDQDPVGRMLTIPASGIGPLARTVNERGTEYRVVGVVGAVRNAGLGAPPEPAIYFPSSQFRYRGMHLVARGADPAVLAAVLRDEVRALDPGLALDDVTALGEVLASASGSPRLFSTLMSGFATVALTLAAVGIFAVLAYAVGERRGEIGVRLALGARPHEVLAMVLRQGLGLALLGALLGALGALFLTRWLESLLYGVGSRDPLAFAVAIGLVVTVAVVASLLPALRAARVDPAQALRVG